MRIPLSCSLYAVATLTCLDSLIKVGLGSLYMQLGLLIALLMLGMLYINTGYVFKVRLASKDNTVAAFLALLLLGFFTALNTAVYLQMLFYFLVYTLVYYYIGEVAQYVNLSKLSMVCILILCATGIVQYVLINVFSFQLELRGMENEYYLGNGDLATRMRGFFLEPNWFGLVLFSWLYIYLRGTSEFSRIKVGILILALICLFLSGNRLMYVFVVLLFASHLCRVYLNNFKRVIPLILLCLGGGAFIYLSLAGGLEGDRSAAARFYTGYNVFMDMFSSPLSTQIFGNGFSNWGWFSNELELSWSNYLFDQSLTRRDNSELYVLFFEMGFIGLSVFLYDAIFLGGKKNADIVDLIYLICIYWASMFYPLYTFLMYMIPMMIVRSRVINS